MKTNEKLRTYALSEIAHTKVHGRTTGRLDPLTLFWTGSGVEWNVKASELWIEVEADYDYCEPWISVVVNGAWVSRQMIAAGRQWLCVFRSMNENAVKNVRVVKDTQAMSGDPACLLQIRSVRCDGEFLPVADKPRKIEFVGDSITSGEGAIGATVEQDWIPMWFSAIDNYAAMTAEALDAEYRIVSQSGWGVVTGWDNNPHASLPAYYEQVCGLLSGDRNRELGALEANDFAAWQPDVVVVNLGTNDDGAFHYQAWRDPQTGETYEQRLNEDGTLNADDVAVFERAVAQFVGKMRRCNRDAHIVWAYGMLGTAMLPAIERAVGAYRAQSGDERVSVVRLPEMTADAVGARNHPGKRAHAHAAAALVEAIRPLLN
ncbi:GDSL-like Lipase/Acylhydrolase family protein [Cohnella sp. OV330]|uniref:SGNH/GDSL hydrolase family protein n=1 Tax=Cohnella sp. OV330 TaxID=1855288 RepID=UPI0008EA3D2E|nr:SGNH/GDSL hydrolase family protein [Cohnella sp. OV330]SFB52484.1 GDSL-like Lipase/Acylhydrolase family protein [Cohnella sp. OV330]